MWLSWSAFLNLLCEAWNVKLCHTNPFASHSPSRLTINIAALQSDWRHNHCLNFTFWSETDNLFIIGHLPYSCDLDLFPVALWLYFPLLMDVSVKDIIAGNGQEHNLVQSLVLVSAVHGYNWALCHNVHQTLTFREQEVPLACCIHGQRGTSKEHTELVPSSPPLLSHRLLSSSLFSSQNPPTQNLRRILNRNQPWLRLARNLSALTSENV